MKKLFLLYIVIALISLSTQMNRCPATTLPRGAVATLEADDLEDLSPKVLKEMQSSVDSSCLISCSFDFNNVCKQKSFVAVSIKSTVYNKYCKKGKPCYCRNISGAVWNDIVLRKGLIATRDNLKDLCSRQTICKKDKRFVAYSDTYFTASFLESLKLKVSKKICICL